MKFCMLSAAEWSGKFTGCGNDIFDWISVFDGEHRGVCASRAKNHEELNEFDVVLMVDVDRYLEDAIQIADECSCKTVFMAEGTIDRYTAMSFDHQKFFFRVLQKVDLIGALEENRMSWYNALWPETKTFFMHCPMSEAVIDGSARVAQKEDRVLACCNLGFGKPHTKTNLITTLGVIKKTGKRLLMCEVPEDQLQFIAEEMGLGEFGYVSRVPWDAYLRKVVAPSKLMLNTSNMIGTSRNAIFGAGCGTPVIGNMHSHTQQRLWPRLASHVYDVDTMAKLVDQLYTDEAFYSDVCAYALEGAQFYSRENAKKRFEEALEGIL